MNTQTIDQNVSSSSSVAPTAKIGRPPKRRLGQLGDDARFTLDQMIIAGRDISDISKALNLAYPDIKQRMKTVTYRATQPELSFKDQLAKDAADDARHFAGLNALNDQNKTPRKEVAAHILKRYAPLNVPVINSNKEAMRQKLVATPLRRYVRVYAAAILVHDMDDSQISEYFGICHASAKSMRWQVNIDCKNAGVL